VKGNLEILDSAISGFHEVQRLKVEAGWYATLRIPAIAEDEQTVLALLQSGVWVQPGYYFGMPKAGWLVLSLLTPMQEFSTGVIILVDYLRTHLASNLS
jgi:alanine-synthesizing transaminase